MTADDSDIRADPAFENTSLNHESISDALEKHPVRLAVLFGSHAEGNTHTDSDVDIAVEFEDDTDPVESYLPLVADLSSVTDGLHIDVGVLSDVNPRIGMSMCRNGVLLRGEQDRFDHHCRRFRERVQDDERKPVRQRLREHVETAKQAVVRSEPPRDGSTDDSSDSRRPDDSHQ